MSIYVVNLLSSNNIESTKKKWEKYSQELANSPDIYAAHLFEVSKAAKEENSVDFQLISIVEGKNSESHEKAKREILKQDGNQILETGIETFAEIQYAHGDLKFDSDKIILISPVRIRQDQTEEFLSHWFSANEIMITKKGFRGVNFLKALDVPTSKVKFINIAEWESLDHIKNALTSQEYIKSRERANQFRNGLSPALCKHIHTIKANI